jgi:hypothetical protein
MTTRSFFVTAVSLFSAALLGCSRDPTTERLYTNIGYARFKSVVGVEGFDPQGAANINYRSFKTKTGHDVWLSMTIPAADYRALHQRFSKDLDDPDVASPDVRPIGPVRKATGKDPSVPQHWPRPGADAPAWWTPPEAGTNLVCTLWELQVEDRRASGRAKGWYWLYDRSASVLWIWEWTHQPCDLGWTPGRS